MSKEGGVKEGMERERSRAGCGSCTSNERVAKKNIARAMIMAKVDKAHLFM